LALTDETIVEILTVKDNDEKQNQANIEQFKHKLHEWKVEHNLNLNRKNESVVKTVLTIFYVFSILGDKILPLGLHQL
jgi:hypothetical protein